MIFDWNRSTIALYDFRLNLIKLPTLKSRRIMLYVTFVVKFIQGFVVILFKLRLSYLEFLGHIHKAVDIETGTGGNMFKTVELDKHVK